MDARLDGSGSALYVGTNAGAVDGQLTNAGVFIPPGGDTLSTPFVTPLMPIGTDVFRILLYCSESSEADCHPISRSALEVVGAETTLLESLPPSVSITGGTILDDGTQTGARTLQYSAADNESGVASVDVLVDDVVAIHRDLEPDCPHTGLAACPKSQVEDLSIDTSALANGPHRLKVRAMDAAGNLSEVDATHVIDVRNTREEPAVQLRGARLTASFAGSSGRTLTADYSRRVTVRGRLAASDGTPVGKAPILLADSKASKAAREVAQTDADGRFSFRLARGGRSRTIRLQYLPVGASEVVLAAPLTLKVRAAAQLSVSLAGVEVRYKGRLVSAHVPAKGVLVILQGRRERGIWQPFAYRKVQRAGTFRGTYRLRVHRPGVRLQFRAVIPRSGGYPYEAGKSATVARTVR
jgi:hypothetical protein